MEDHLYKEGGVGTVKWIMTCLALCLMAYGVMAQQIDTRYEPMPEFPYGRPNPDLDMQLEAFHPMIGTCNCSAQYRNVEGGWADTTSLRWDFKYIMNGKAVQDINWLDNGGHTTSIRMFDEQKEQWYVTFFAVPSARPMTLIGGQEGEQIVLKAKQKAPNGMDGFFQVVFSNISTTGFHWRGSWVDEQGTIEYVTAKVWCEKSN